MEKSAPATVEQRIAGVLEQLRPYLESDGVECRLVRVDGATAYVDILARQPCCATLLMTIKTGIESRIIEAVPEIESVEPHREET